MRISIKVDDSRLLAVFVLFYLELGGERIFRPLLSSLPFSVCPPRTYV